MPDERERDLAAVREAVRIARQSSPGANIEAAVRLIRAGAAMHGIATR